MALQAQYLMSVVFLTAPGDGRRLAAGTAFFVHVDTVQRHRYLVTAKHNIEGRSGIAVRVGRPEGGVIDLPEIAQEAWSHHRTADVSATLIDHPAAAIFHASIPIKNFVPLPEEEHLMLGTEVFFIGLLRRLPRMEEENLPMLRNGALGSLNLQGVNIMDDQSKIVTPLPYAHLIDCRAYQGMSGAPCFAQRLEVRSRPGQDPPVDLVTMTYLLGLISGHFDEKAQVSDEDWTGGSYPIHTGVAVATPARFIYELLMEDKDLKNARDKADEAVRLRQEDELVATADSAGPSDSAPDSASSIAATEDLLRKLVNPAVRDEADEIHRGHQS